VDGIMIGRASIGNPWIFNEIKHFLKTGEELPKAGIETRVETCRLHFNKSLEWKGDITGIHEMRRHYANYFKGLSHFKEYRMKLVTSYDMNEIHAILDEIKSRYKDLAA
jgi:tRNA-dihydrouridine synthase